MKEAANEAVCAGVLLLSIFALGWISCCRSERAAPSCCLLCTPASVLFSIFRLENYVLCCKCHPHDRSSKTSERESLPEQLQSAASYQVLSRAADSAAQEKGELGVLICCKLRSLGLLPQQVEVQPAAQRSHACKWVGWAVGRLGSALRALLREFGTYRRVTDAVQI